jgi:lactoylglutathione lyase
MKCLAAMVVSATLPLLAGGQASRPHILGISHIGLYVHDLAKARAFYKDFLGFAEPYSLSNSDGTVRVTWIKIDDRQSIELFPEKEAGSDRLYHIALETEDAAAMREYLATRGVKVPETVPKGKIGNLNYFITDPDGRTVEIVQYATDGWTARYKGRFLPDTRISSHMPHVGVLEGDLDAAQKFYGDILGCKETWRGTRDPSQLSWVHEQVPDGTDYIELMLYSDLPGPDKRGKAHHLCLIVPDLAAALAVLKQRAEPVGYAKPLELQVGVNRKRQLNLWDPDGTRVELMEPTTIDGIAAPSSTAPPPRRRLTQQP